MNTYAAWKGNEEQQQQNEEQKWMNNNIKNLPGGSPKQKHHRWEFLLSWCPIKKMITEVLLVLPLYLILFFIRWRSRPVIKAMASVENILKDDYFFGDIVDTSKWGIEQHKKRESLKSVIDRGKAYLLGHKWTQEKVDKASDEIINKTYAEYKQREITEKAGKSAKGLGKHAIKLYSTGISQWFKTKDVKKLNQDIEDDPLIKDQMVNLGCFLVHTLGDRLALVLVAAHTLNNLDCGNHENEDYESEVL